MVDVQQLSQVGSNFSLGKGSQASVYKMLLLSNTGEESQEVAVKIYERPLFYLQKLAHFLNEV